MDVFICLHCDDDDDDDDDDDNDDDDDDDDNDDDDEDNDDDDDDDDDDDASLHRYTQSIACQYTLFNASGPIYSPVHYLPLPDMGYLRISSIKSMRGIVGHF